MTTTAPLLCITAMSVNTGLIRPLLVGRKTMLSAIGKTARTGSVAVTRMGLEGDHQADLRVHGGPSKAVYAYPAAHYALWQTQRREHNVCLLDEDLPPGWMGENLTVSGPLEDALFVDDVLQFPHCALRVSAPREPCSKFTAIMGFAQAAKVMVQTGCCGYYLSVDTEGHLSAGETAVVVPGPRTTSVAQAFRAIFG